MEGRASRSVREAWCRDSIRAISDSEQRSPAASVGAKALRVPRAAETPEERNAKSGERDPRFPGSQERAEGPRRRRAFPWFGTEYGGRAVHALHASVFLVETREGGATATTCLRPGSPVRCVTCAKAIAVRSSICRAKRGVAPFSPGLQTESTGSEEHPSGKRRNAPSLRAGNRNRGLHGRFPVSGPTRFCCRCFEAL